MFEHWEPGEATIVAMRALTNWSSNPNNTGGPSQSTPYEYVVDVRPPDQPPFRATFRDSYIRGHMRHPSEGEVVDVLYDPKSHKVKLVASEWKGSPHEEERQEAERWNAIAHAPVGEGEPAGSEPTRIDAGERRVIPPPSD